jgi:multiple sugar transport system permease protein
MKKNTHHIVYWKKSIEPYVFIIPALVIIAIIDFFPLIYTIVISFTNSNLLIEKPNFIGIDNYSRIVKDKVFWESFINTWIWVFGTVFIPAILGLVNAILLNRPLKGRTFFRVLLFLPWVMPSIVTALMWKLLLHPQLGAIDRILMNLGVINSQIVWLSDPQYAMIGVTLGGTWKATAFFTLMLLAGLQAISLELYEAAEVEGASFIQSFVYITIPGLKPVIFVSMLMQTIWMINWMDLIWALTKGGPVHYTQVLTTYAYTMGFVALDFGYAATISVLICIIGALIAMSLIYFIKPSAESILN